MVHSVTYKTPHTTSRDSNQPTNPCSLISLHWALKWLPKVKGTVTTMIRLCCCKAGLILCRVHMSRSMTKPIKWHVHPAKTQISLGIRPVWSDSSLPASWVAKDQCFFMRTEKLWSVWADPKANLSLHWAYRSFYWLQRLNYVTVGFAVPRLKYLFLVLCFSWERATLKNERATLQQNLSSGVCDQIILKPTCSATEAS